MVYVAGFVGLIGGFVLGQMLLLFLLRNASREDLLNDKYLKWKYGILNWIIAIIGVYCSVATYERFFG